MSNRINPSSNRCNIIMCNYKLIYMYIYLDLCNIILFIVANTNEK